MKFYYALAEEKRNFFGYDRKSVFFFKYANMAKTHSWAEAQDNDNHNVIG